MMTEPHFNIGDSIIAKDHPGTDMVIVGYESGKIQCAWVEQGGEIKEEAFKISELIHDRPASAYDGL